jgi:hypothetical protein
LIPWLVPGGVLALECGARAVARRWGRAGGRGRRDLHPLLAAAGAALGGLVLVAELNVVGTATARDQAKLPTVLSPGLYVLVTDLVQADDGLPRLPLVRDGATPPRVDPAFDYRGFRDRLFAALRPRDLHAIDDGRAYVLAAAIFGLAGLTAMAATSLAPACRDASGDTDRLADVG